RAGGQAEDEARQGRPDERAGPVSPREHPRDDGHHEQRHGVLDQQRRHGLGDRPGHEERVGAAVRAEEVRHHQVPDEAEPGSGADQHTGQDGGAPDRGHGRASPAAGSPNARHATTPRTTENSTQVGPPRSAYTKLTSRNVMSAALASQNGSRGRRRAHRPASSGPNSAASAARPTTPCSARNSRYWLCGERSGCRSYPRTGSAVSLPDDSSIPA